MDGLEGVVRVAQPEGLGNGIARNKAGAGHAGEAATSKTGPESIVPYLMLRNLVTTHRGEDTRMQEDLGSGEVSQPDTRSQDLLAWVTIHRSAPPRYRCFPKRRQVSGSCQ